MKKLLIMLAVVSLAGATPVAAQLDQDPDGIGLYADLEGLNNQLLTEPGIVEVYVLATSITGVRIENWGAVFAIEGNAVVTAITAPYDFDYAYWNPDQNSYGYAVGMLPWLGDCAGLGLSPAPVVHLATLQLWVSDADPINLYVGPVELNEDLQDPESMEPEYFWRECDGEEVTYHKVGLNRSSGDRTLPVMRINGDAPIPVEPKSWSDLKTVFR